MDDLQHEQRVLAHYLKHHRTHTGKAGTLLSDTSLFQELLLPFFTPLSRKLSEWATSHFEHNTSHPEQLIHKTPAGHLVRSKSEYMIASFLFQNKIPYRYECALSLCDITLFPDFTIRHPQTGEYYYWEHFDLIDNPYYCKSTCSKLQLYMTEGLIPTINLITTFETKDNPLDYEIIEKIIEHYFL